MKPFLLLLLGFSLAFLSQTLFGSIGFYVLFLLYCSSLFLFFRMSPVLGRSFLVGLTCNLELLGTWHFGLASAFGLFLYWTAFLFAERLRFTSAHARYIVAMLCLLIGYLSFFGAWSSLTKAWLPLTLLIILASIASYGLLLLGRHQSYEVST